MSGRKNVILPVQILNAEMTADVSSNLVNVQYLDSIGLEISWTAAGSPSGTILIQGSNSYKPNSGAFYSLTFSPALTQPDGSTAPGGYLVNLSQFPYAYLRVFYDYTSGGSGDFLSVWLTAKEL